MKRHAAILVGLAAGLVPGVAAGLGTAFVAADEQGEAPESPAT